MSRPTINVGVAAALLPLALLVTLGQTVQVFTTSNNAARAITILA